MGELYWACDAEAVPALSARLERPAPVAGLGNGRTVLHMTDADERLVRLTVRLLADGRIHGAALVSAPLPQERLWFAAEWGGVLVADTAAAEPLARLADILAPAKSHMDLDLRIFRPRTLPDRYAAADDVLADPARFYGDLADPDLGGANVLFAAGRDAAQERGLSGEILIGEPEDFGFIRDTGEHSVVAWRRRSIIDVKAFGFRLGEHELVRQFFAEHRVEDAHESLYRDTEDWRSQDLHFGVAMILIGLEDPPVVIPSGSVYQQPQMGAPMQNLAVAQPASPMVAAGATVPLILPAWCLNQTLSPPAGPLSPTPLVAAGAAGSQGEVWDGLAQRYRSRR